MDPKKCPLPTQDHNVLNKNFKEVALGYTEEMAVNEAKRCVHCKNKPCQTGCPVGIDIPEFIGHVAEGDFEAAYQVINRSSSLPAAVSYTHLMCIRDRANSSAESARTLAPHCGQSSGFSAATARLGSSQWPHCGQG